MHRNTDEVDLAWNGAVVWIVGVTETAAERERAVVGKTILYYTQGLSLRRAQHVKVI